MKKTPIGKIKLKQIEFKTEKLNVIDKQFVSKTARLAQTVEQEPCKLQVIGATPITGSK